MNAHLFILFFYAVFSLGTLAAQPLVGTWYHDEIDDRRTTTTEMMFGSDGSFAQTIAVATGGAPAASIVDRIEGKWEEQGSYFILKLPSTAPVGVSPREDRTVKFHIEKLTDEELSFTEVGRVRLFEFRKRTQER